MLAIVRMMLRVEPENSLKEEEQTISPIHVPRTEDGRCMFVETTDAFFIRATENNEPHPASPDRLADYEEKPNYETGKSKFARAYLNDQAVSSLAFNNIAYFQILEMTEADPSPDSL
jgi:crotonobetainyl-CoA:carnitine CoA-transferase CaiB-like acyl-CoA transferase